MRLVITSDTHEQHSKLSVPDGDVFIHCGDFTMIGEEHWVKNFNQWLGTLPHKYKIVIAGNHDRGFDLKALEGAPAHAMRYYGKDRLTHATHYLLNDGCEINGIRFWGSPYTPIFHSDYWKFHYDRAKGHELWAYIPKDLHVLITHGPADRVLDRTLEGDYVGCYDLLKRIREVRPNYHFFGHIHEGYGHREIDGTRHYNVSAVDRLYRLRDNPCIVVDI